MGDTWVGSGGVALLEEVCPLEQALGALGLASLVCCPCFTPVVPDVNLQLLGAVPAMCYHAFALPHWALTPLES